MSLQFCAGGRIQTVRVRRTRIAGGFVGAHCDVEECARPLPGGSECWSYNGRRGCTEAHCELAVRRQGLGS